jgi:CRP-like cAMP-binding protein
VNPRSYAGPVAGITCPVEPPSNEHRTRRGTLTLANVTLKGIAVLFDTCPSNRLRRNLDVPLFADCTNRELRRVDALSTIVTRGAGQVLCRQGEIGRECFVLLDGEVDVDTSGRHYTVATGALLGEIALLITNGRRSATVIARTEVTLLVFSRTEFSELMQGLPMVAHKILNEATRRLLENAEARSAPAS